MHPTGAESRRICFGEDHGYCCPDGIYIPQPDGTSVHRDDLTNTVTPADILRYAALYLYRHGWHQGDMFADPDQPTPPACAQGAIRMAVCGSPTVAYTADTSLMVDRAIGEFACWLAWNDPGYLDEFKQFDLHDDDTALDQVAGDWNDEPDRTADEVIAALNAAADSWDRIHPGGAQ